MSQDLSNATLFEVSWEVCNKVGGIYAVVSSKILEALATFGENYFLLGPDLGNNPDFEETDEPCWQELRQETDRRNLNCRFGRWNIPGRPRSSWSATVTAMTRASCCSRSGTATVWTPSPAAGTMWNRSCSARPAAK